MLVKIDPVGKPRMTQSDRWKKRPAVLRYRAFCDELRLKLRFLPEHLDITFLLPMPHSWSEKRKCAMDKAPHTAKPDIDNLLKALLDAMLEDDSCIHTIHGLRKRWARTGGIFFADDIKGA